MWVSRLLVPLLASFILAVTPERATGGPTTPGWLTRSPPDIARKYYVRLTYTWNGQDPCMKGVQSLEGEVSEEFDEDGGGSFGGVLKLTANYVTCGEAVIGNQACLASVKITGQASFGGSILTQEDLGGIDYEGRRVEPGEMEFHWRPIDERTKVSISGTCPKGDDSENLTAVPDYEIRLHFRPPPAGEHRRFVLQPRDWDGSEIVLDVWARSREVVAIPRVRPPVVRAQPVTLDGTASKGENLEYEWTFAPKDCPPGETGHPNAKKTGPSPTVTLLCSMNVTLTVTEGALTDSKTIPLSITPRERGWKTPFEHAREVQLPLDAKPTTRPLAISGPSQDSLRFLAALNQCLEDPGAEPDHTLHPLSSNATWENIGYELDQVTDPGGPFDGYWHLSAYKLRVRRQTALSPYLLPGGPAPVQGGARFYERNKAAKKNVDGYLAALRAHEGIGGFGTLGHSGRMRKQLSKADPARVLERTFSRDRTALREKADIEILRAEEDLCEASKDPLPLIWSGEILFPYAGSGKYTAYWASVGGPHSDDSPCD